MKPIREALALFDKFDDDFDTQMRFHLNNGWVYSGEDCFVMATTPEIGGLELESDDLLRLSTNNALDKKCWYIYVYYGNLKRVLGLIPFALEYVCFRRNCGKVRVYEMEKLIRRIGI